MTPLDIAGFLRTPTARHFPTLRKSFHLDVHDVQEQVGSMVLVRNIFSGGRGVGVGWEGGKLFHTVSEKCYCEKCSYFRTLEIFPTRTPVMLRSAYA